MKKSRIRSALIGITLALLIQGCAHEGGRHPPPVVLPRPYTTLATFVPQIQSIIEGTVDDVWYEYEDCTGPRTVITLHDVATYLGDKHDKAIRLQVFGGTLPDGRYVSLSDSPRYVLGSRYLLFLRNTDWKFSPVIGDHAYRLEQFDGRQLLINSDGFAVTGINESGIVTGAAQLTGSVGERIVGRKVSDKTQLELLAPPPQTAGESKACGGGGKPSCQSAETSAARSRALRDELVRSGALARPAWIESMDSSAVNQSIGARELVGALGEWAQQHSVKIGGYYAEHPRIGCWSRTPAQRLKR